MWRSWYKLSDTATRLISSTSHDEFQFYGYNLLTLEAHIYAPLFPLAIKSLSGWERRFQRAEHL